jgi:hypothetical protein
MRLLLALVFFAHSIFTILAAYEMIEKTNFAFHNLHFEIQQVLAQSPAEKIDLKPGDIITHINSQKITSDLDLVLKLQENINTEITLTLLRDRQFLEKKVTVPGENTPETGKLGITYKSKGFTWIYFILILKEIVAAGIFLIATFFLLRRNILIPSVLSLPVITFNVVMSVQANYTLGVIYFGVILFLILLWLFESRSIIRSFLSKFREKE